MQYGEAKQRDTAERAAASIIGHMGAGMTLPRQQAREKEKKERKTKGKRTV